MECRNDVLFIVGWIDPQANIEYVAFKFNLYMFHKIGPNIGIVSMVKKDEQFVAMESINSQCTLTTWLIHNWGLKRNV